MNEPNEQQQPDPRGDAPAGNSNESRGDDRTANRTDDQPDSRWWENRGPHGEVH